MKRFSLSLARAWAVWVSWHARRAERACGTVQVSRLRTSWQQRQRWLAAVLCLLAASATSVASAAQAAEVTDDRGRTLRFDKPAMRVVSLLPSLTESVCALGACQRLVGVDRYSDWPAQVQRLPQVGGGLNPSVEAIVALRPDVVLASESSRATERLAALGVKVVALRTQTHADVRKGLTRIAAILGLPAQQADAVWQSIGQGIAQAAQTVPPAARGQRVFIEVSRGPYAAGEQSFIGETLRMLGMKNAVPATQGPFPKLNPEFVVRADPDLIIFAHRAAQDQALYPGWQQLRAVRQQRLCRLSEQDANLLVRPGPRMAEGAAVLARCIQRIGVASGAAPAGKPQAAKPAQTLAPVAP
ncbi:MAG: helical backbone metal receptor [Brachymonas sp.]|nr:helical backbone metal receptor [Brachymonas sp.]